MKPPTELNDWVFEYCENKQAMLHNVDLMLDLTNEEKQSRSVTEREEFFAELCERSALSQNNMNAATDKKSHLRNNKKPCFGRIDSKSID